jgi:hypothetical protein
MEELNDSAVHDASSRILAADEQQKVAERARDLPPPHPPELRSDLRMFAWISVMPGVCLGIYLMATGRVVAGVATEVSMLVVGFDWWRRFGPGRGGRARAVSTANGRADEPYKQDSP